MQNFLTLRARLSPLKVNFKPCLSSSSIRHIHSNASPKTSTDLSSGFITEDLKSRDYTLPLSNSQKGHTPLKFVDESGNIMYAMQLKRVGEAVLLESKRVSELIQSRNVSQKFMETMKHISSVITAPKDAFTNPGLMLSKADLLAKSWSRFVDWEYSRNSEELLLSEQQLVMKFLNSSLKKYLSPRFSFSLSPESYQSPLYPISLNHTYLAEDFGQDVQGSPPGSSKIQASPLNPAVSDIGLDLAFMECPSPVEALFTTKMADQPICIDPPVSQTFLVKSPAYFYDPQTQPPLLQPLDADNFSDSSVSIPSDAPFESLSCVVNTFSGVAFDPYFFLFQENEHPMVTYDTSSVLRKRAKKMKKHKHKKLLKRTRALRKRLGK
eukprot:Sdes_comp20131_c0_seq1m13220